MLIFILVLSAYLLERELSLEPNFQKGGKVLRSQFLEAVSFLRGVAFFICIKNKLKSEIFKNKKIYKQKSFSLL